MTRRISCSTLVSIFVVANLAGCVYDATPARPKRFIGGLAESEGTLYVATSSMRGMSGWRSEFWAVDVATGSSRRLSSQRQITRSIAVDDAGNLLAVTAAKPSRLDRGWEPFEVWLYPRANRYRGRYLGKGGLRGLPAPGMVLSSRDTFDAEGFVATTQGGGMSGQARALNPSPTEQVQMDRATTTDLRLLPYKGAPVQLAQWEGSVGVKAGGRWIAADGRTLSAAYELVGNEAAGWKLRAVPASAGGKPAGYYVSRALSPTGDLAMLGELSPTRNALVVRHLPKGTVSPRTELPGGRVDAMVWSHSGATLALTVSTQSGAWTVLEVDPSRRSVRTLLQPPGKPRHLTPVGPTSFAVVTGNTNSKRSVIMLPEKKALFEWQ